MHLMKSSVWQKKIDFGYNRILTKSILTLRNILLP